MRRSRAVCCLTTSSAGRRYSRIEIETGQAAEVTGEDAGRRPASRATVRRVVGAALVMLVATAMAGPASAASGRHAGVGPAPAQSRVRALDPAEQHLFALLNADRAAAGRQPLVLNERLCAFARAHSLEMGRDHYLGHASSSGVPFSGRVKAMGIPFHTFAENVGEATEGASAAAALDMLNTAMMAEPLTGPNHHTTLINPALHEVGVGVVITPDNHVFLTEDLIG
jgi:uncharacterized protein YkwD